MTQDPRKLRGAPSLTDTENRLLLHDMVLRKNPEDLEFIKRSFPLSPKRPLAKYFDHDSKPEYRREFQLVNNLKPTPADLAKYFRLVDKYAELVESDSIPRGVGGNIHNRLQWHEAVITGANKYGIANKIGIDRKSLREWTPSALDRVQERRSYNLRDIPFFDYEKNRLIWFDTPDRF